jgi:glycosyltransferase involved in cell wall biosynthesis
MKAPNSVDVSVVLPCLDEEDGVGVCVKKVFDVFSQNGIAGEVVVVDNGSADRTAAVAVSAGARVVSESKRGYGAAYLKGFTEARGRVIVMADADDTYDFCDMPHMLSELDKGIDIVLASRFLSKGDSAAMPVLHRYFGNPVLTAFLNVLFGTSFSDCHTGFRVFRAEILPRLRLRATGMEFASEFLVRAVQEGLVVREVMTTLRPRIGRSKLRRIRDAVRHIMLLLALRSEIRCSRRV